MKIPPPVCPQHANKWHCGASDDARDGVEAAPISRCVKVKLPLYQQSRRRRDPLRNVRRSRMRELNRSLRAKMAYDFWKIVKYSWVVVQHLISVEYIAFLEMVDANE